MLMFLTVCRVPGIDRWFINIYDIYKYLLHVLTPSHVSDLKALTELRSSYIYPEYNLTFIFLFVLPTFSCKCKGESSESQRSPDI